MSSVSTALKTDAVNRLNRARWHMEGDAEGACLKPPQFP